LPSAEDAGRAFFAAMQAQDDQGPFEYSWASGKRLSSRPAIERKMRMPRIGFVVKYQEIAPVVTESNGTVARLSSENWPFPIPLVNNHGSWYSTPRAGKDEIVFRRIGKNELAAMDACRKEKKNNIARPPADLPKQYAQKLVSDEGRHNGLYWQGASDESDSPINLSSLTRAKISPTDQVGEHGPFNG